MHADLDHLFSNSVFFTCLAFLLNGYFVKWIFPALSFFAGVLINLLILPCSPADVAIVGASGMVYFMAALWLTLYFLIDRRHSATRRWMNVTALALILFVPEVLQERVSYLSHGVGFFLGSPAATLLFTLKMKSIRSHGVWQDVTLENPALPEAEELAYFENPCLCGVGHSITPPFGPVPCEEQGRRGTIQYPPMNNPCYH